ncbi:putative protein OS=Tsukamurella paurometabola (strain ATCC 8368 / DSM / CCUG 35730 /CIP 100753 / JCM 10117 / KCTC 9821 / NBRC 16120 / NCIMB 702349/ NCTC 13040) OX=521096 GN=Tpau_0275 PE=4 SV=1 [Tsukamurella paurometabola]|uniref:Uncharacterized protein n=1 Tax=Tsukamurella paurometabola (strain ATCC 8368 / DSM 20162 / CCUG 35730 / CIP 100753 / JCM 10117 / KCTC 9821 / NBRC 16120 / NCIMB 702349 / NCTC 13040) TaxID=521096 RepID=D5UQU1_TSUPD|nr:hypothetical protein [Tsukamurella paurometabola]ADG76924.1 hypothetical protein Tpau_0275 [Tsukamurella paurometabola DSM 20162]SUP42222.1 Uncharacterised protein [Tsukamurella paurometabola]
MTVCRALINPASANLRGLYVALTRGKAENHAYTATPATIDEHTEDQHLHGAGDERAADNSRAILAVVLAKDDGHKAAVEHIQEALAASTDPQTARDAYTAARDLLVADYTDHLLAAHLPAAIVATIDADPAGKARIRSVVDQLIASGASSTVIGARLNAVHDGLETARNLPAFIAYKINPPASAVAAQEHRAARELFVRDYTDHLLATHLPAAVVATIDADPDSRRSIENAVDRLHAAGATDIPARFADADTRLENLSPGASYTAHLLRSLRRPTHANEQADPSPAQIAAHLHADPAGNAQLNAALTALAPLPDLTPEPDPADLPALPPAHPGADRSLREHAHHAVDSHDRATADQLAIDRPADTEPEAAQPVAAALTTEQLLAAETTPALAPGLDPATLAAAARAVDEATRGPDTEPATEPAETAPDTEAPADPAAAERKALAARTVAEFKQHSIRRLPASELDYIARTGGRKHADRLRELRHHTPREVAEHEASAQRLALYERSYAREQPYRDAITAHRKAIDALDTARTKRDAVARELADTGRLSPRRRELARELDTRTAAVTAAEKAAEDARRTRSQEQARAGKHPVTDGALQAAREHTENARAEAEKAQARQQAKIAELTATITARQQAALTEQERRSQLDPTQLKIEQKLRGAALEHAQQQAQQRKDAARARAGRFANDPARPVSRGVDGPTRGR